MKIAFIFFMLFVFSLNANADPRMQQDNANSFCHFIHELANQDNETYISGLNPQISVIDNIATGFCSIKLKVKNEYVKHDKKILLYDTNSTCTMVETNGNTYQSNDWSSRIIVRRLTKFKKIINKDGTEDWIKVPTGHSNIDYSLLCLDGVQQ